MCFYSRKKLKRLEQDLHFVMMDHKEEYNKVCMLSGRIVRALDYINSFEYYIPEDNKEELIKILKGEDNE